jgi:hypothetical protein
MNYFRIIAVTGSLIIFSLNCSDEPSFIEKAHDKLSAAKEKAVDVWQDASEKVKETYAAAKEKVEDGYVRTKATVKKSAQKVRHYFTGHGARYCTDGASDALPVNDDSDDDCVINATGKKTAEQLVEEAA